MDRMLTMITRHCVVSK